MYQTEHDELFASIRAGKPINNGEYMAKSTLHGHHGPHGHLHRPGDHLGHSLNSKEDLTPAKYEFGPLPMPPVAVPGVTKFS